MAFRDLREYIGKLGEERGTAYLDCPLIHRPDDGDGHPWVGSYQ
ncbi:MAG: hypothetical protein Q8P59_10775 [Dehalococcoidia bacterium]|nr:hypothetical protein [Dehalococcoidia bacterium]